MPRDDRQYPFEEHLFPLGVASVPNELLEGQVARCENAYPARHGAIEQRRGYAALAEAAGITSARAIRRFLNDDGSHAGLLVWAGDALYSVQNGHSHLLKTGLDTAGRIAHEAWNDRVYYSDGVTGLHAVEFSHDPTTAELITQGVKLVSKFVGVDGNNTTLELHDPVAASQAVAVAVTGTDIHVDLATGAQVLGHIDAPSATLPRLTLTAKALHADATTLTIVDPGDTQAATASVTTGTDIVVTLKTAPSTAHLDLPSQSFIDMIVAAVNSGAAGDAISLQLVNNGIHAATTASVVGTDITVEVAVAMWYSTATTLSGAAAFTRWNRPTGGEDSLEWLRLAVDAQAVGEASQGISVEVYQSAGAATLAVSTDGKHVHVRLATDSSGLVTSTSHAVADAINTHGTASTMVHATYGAFGGSAEATASGAFWITSPYYSATASSTGTSQQMVVATWGEVKTAMDANNDIAALVAVTVVSDHVCGSTNRAYLAGGADHAIVATWADVKTAIEADTDAAALVTVATTLPTAIASAFAHTHMAGESHGVIASTLTTLVAAINGNTDAATLVTASVVGTGATLVAASAAQHLVGGLDAGDYRSVLVTASHSFTALARRNASERLFGVDAADATNLRWCDAYTPATWGGTSMASPGGAFVTGGEVGDMFVAVTDGIIYRIDGSDPTAWRMNPVQSDGLGCRARLTFAVVGGMALWWSAKGLVYFDGTRPKLLSELIYDPSDAAHSLIPNDPACWDKMFAITTGTQYILCFPSEAAHECDRAIVYDFSLNAFGGPYMFGFEATCGHVETRGTGDAMLVTLGTTGSVLIEDTDAFTDAGTPYTMRVRFRKQDGGSPLRDWLFNKMRFLYTAAASAAITLRFVAEGEASPRSGATVTATVPAGEDVLMKRLPNVRARAGYIEVEAVTAGAFTVEGYGVYTIAVNER
jgi:hypothetical protein